MSRDTYSFVHELRPRTQYASYAWYVVYICPHLFKKVIFVWFQCVPSWTDFPAIRVVVVVLDRGARSESCVVVVWNIRLFIGLFVVRWCFYSKKKWSIYVRIEVCWLCVANGKCVCFASFAAFGTRYIINRSRWVKTVKSNALEMDTTLWIRDNKWNYVQIYINMSLEDDGSHNKFWHLFVRSGLQHSPKKNIIKPKTLIIQSKNGKI